MPINLFFPGTDNRADKQYWETHTICKQCPVNIDCLEYALDQDLEYGLYCLPERVRRRFKTKPPKISIQTSKANASFIVIYG